MAPASNPTALERPAFFFFVNLLLTQERETDTENSEYDSTDLAKDGKLLGFLGMVTLLVRELDSPPTIHIPSSLLQSRIFFILLS